MLESFPARLFRSAQRRTHGRRLALEQIKAMYAIEEQIRDKALAGEAKHLHR